MITITASLWLWSGEGGSWHFLTIPAEEAVEIRLESAASGIRRGFGSVRVNANINGVAWTTSVFPQPIRAAPAPIAAAIASARGAAPGRRGGAPAVALLGGTQPVVAPRIAEEVRY